jgi:hypothetical protein
MRGRVRAAAMDAGNHIGPAAVASLMLALEKMPQLTSLDLAGARIGFGRGSSMEGFDSWVLLGCSLKWGAFWAALRLDRVCLCGLCGCCRGDLGTVACEVCA